MNLIKIKLLGLVGISSLITMTAGASAQYTEKEIGLGIIDAYIPAGLKTNQDAFLVVNGLFPNACYTFSSAEVIHIDDFTHQVKTLVKVRSGACARVMTPFNQQISLGDLKPGEHKIKMVSDDDTDFEKVMVI